MAEMKDSGTAWLGMIPKDWKLSKISSIYELRTQKVSDKDYPPLSVTMNGIVPQLDSAAKTNAHDDRKLVKKGDFAINSRSDRRGSCGVSEYDGSVSLINTVMKPRDEMNPNYYNWLFHTIQFADEFYKWGHGIVDDLWTTNWQDMKHIDIPVPTLDEQKVIADYLNKVISEIDALYMDIEKQIETLEEYKKSIITEAVTKGLEPDVEMKDSGIEWIGKIPKNWEIKKIRYVAKGINDVNHYMPNDSEDIDKVPYLMIGDLKDKISDVDFEKCKHISRKDYMVLSIKGKNNKDDVIFARYATIGTVMYIDEDSDFLVSYACLTIKPQNNIYGKFLFYYFKSKAFFEDISQYININTQGNIGKVSLAKTKITVPFIREQQQIVKYLDKKCAEIDGAIEGKKEQLEILKQYKKSIIYEYVTGKKEVPDNE